MYFISCPVDDQLHNVVLQDLPDYALASAGGQVVGHSKLFEDGMSNVRLHRIWIFLYKIIWKLSSICGQPLVHPRANEVNFLLILLLNQTGLQPYWMNPNCEESESLEHPNLSMFNSITYHAVLRFVAVILSFSLSLGSLQVNACLWKVLQGM